jgi:hypothetical protein
MFVLMRAFKSFSWKVIEVTVAVLVRESPRMTIDGVSAEDSMTLPVKEAKDRQLE